MANGGVERLSFWRKFEKVHRQRIARTEAPLAPELLRGVREHIQALEQMLRNGG